MILHSWTFEKKRDWKFKKFIWLLRAYIKSTCKRSKFYIKLFFIRILMKKKTKEYNIEKYSKKHAILSNFYHIVLPICARQFYKNFDLSRSILRVAIQRIIDISVSRFPLFSINHGVRLIMTFFATTKHKDLRPLFVRLFPQEGRKSHP